MHTGLQHQVWIVVVVVSDVEEVIPDAFMGVIASYNLQFQGFFWIYFLIFFQFLKNTKIYLLSLFTSLWLNCYNINRFFFGFFNIDKSSSDSKDILKSVFAHFYNFLDLNSNILLERLAEVRLNTYMLGLTKCWSK